VTGLVVSIVVDREFGGRVDETAARGPVWIAESATNRAAAEAWRIRHAASMPHDGVTVFRVNPAGPPERWVADILSTVELHYGAYDERPPTFDVLEVWGAPLTSELEGRLIDDGYIAIVPRPDGFRATRVAPAV
jgi:hypothetical protein